MAQLLQLNTYLTILLEENMRYQPYVLGLFLYLSFLSQGMASMQAMGRNSRPVASDLSPKQKALVKWIQRGEFSKVSRLLNEGINPNYFFGNARVSPLSEAIATRQPKIVNLLLAHGADVNFGAEDGLVPLAIAAWYDDPVLITEFLHHGANLEARDDEGFTPLLEAAAHAKGVHVLELLIEAGADLRKTGEEGETALMLAAAQVNLNAVQLFLRAGLDPCAQDKEGRVAFDYVNPLLNPEAGNQIKTLLSASCGLR
jgi:ankyrin repeat protein